MDFVLQLHRGLSSSMGALVMPAARSKTEDRGRKPGFVMSDDHRVKIQNSNILNALIEHVEGIRNMSSTQVSAGVALLKKVLPDLQVVELTGKDGGPIETVDLSPLEYARRIAFSLEKGRQELNKLDK